MESVNTCRFAGFVAFSGWLGLVQLSGAPPAAPQDPAPRVEPAQTSALANIRLRMDRRVFAVMAALHVAGFGEGTEEEISSALRNTVLEWSRDVDAGLLQELRDFYESHQPPPNLFLEHPQTAYVSLALWLTSPPDFELQVDPADLPPEAWFVRDFGDLVRRFWSEARLTQRWPEVEPLHRRELERYRPLLAEIVARTLQYFRVPLRLALGKEIVLIPDLLNSEGLVNARNLERTYFVVVGPSTQIARQRGELEHEYLHYLLDSLIQKYGTGLLEHESLLDLAQLQPNTRQDYQNQFLLVASESLIEAVHTRLSPPATPADLDRHLVGLFRRGLILAPYFYRSLEAFEDLPGTTLPAYLETAIENLKEDGVRRDARDIEAMEERLKAADSARRRVQQEEEERVRRHNESVDRFNEASRLLADGKFEAARNLLLELQAARPGDGKVLFYLGQTAFQLGDYESALEYYRQCSESSGLDAWVNGWARVRMGRIHASRGEFDKARNLFSGVMTLAGDLRGAAEEAARLLQKLP